MSYIIKEVISLSENEVSADLIRGHIDTIILKILKRGDNYGYEIVKAISNDSNGVYILKEPSLYSSLKRLEKLGFINAYWGDQSQGGRRKYYTITKEGLSVYQENVMAWNRAKLLIDQLVLEGSEQSE